MVTNLVSNALDHTPSDATISLSAERLGDVCVLTVGDDGPGMSSDDAAHIFDRFYRVDDGRRKVTAAPGWASASSRRLSMHITGRSRSTPPRGRVHLSGCAALRATSCRPRRSRRELPGFQRAFEDSGRQ